MNMHPEHPEGVDPLLSEEHEQSVRIDLSSSHTPLPDGLVQRTFEASVAYLPNQQPLVLTPAQRWPMLTRLSMAAAIVLAVGVGIVLLRSPALTGTAPAPDPFALNGVEVGPSIVPASHSNAYALSAEQEWVLMDSVELAQYAEMRHLSLDDVIDDMAMLVHDLEM